MRLQEALETAEQAGFWQRLIFDRMTWLRPIKLAPALTAAIFIVGFAGGIGATYQMVNGPNGQPCPPAAEASITGIQSIYQDPGSTQIIIKYNTVSTHETQGSLNDQRISAIAALCRAQQLQLGVHVSVDL